jgi:PEP-CTERM motif
VGSATAISANGINFQANASGLPDTTHVQYGVYTYSAAVFMPWWISTGNTDFDKVLNTGIYTYDNTPSYIKLTGLTSGSSYQVQLLEVDARNQYVGRKIGWGDSPANAVTALSSALPYSYSNSNPIGLSTVFSFTADSTSQNIFFDPSAGLQLNAVVLDAVPEPASTAMVVLGAGLLFGGRWASRRRR